MRCQNYNNNNKSSNNYNPRRGLNDRDNNSKGGGGLLYQRGPMQGCRGRSRDRTRGPRGPLKGAPLELDAERDFDEDNKLFLQLEAKFRRMKIKLAEEGDGAKSSGDESSGQSESGSGYQTILIANTTKLA